MTSPYSLPVPSPRNSELSQPRKEEAKPTSEIDAPKGLSEEKTLVERGRSLPTNQPMSEEAAACQSTNSHMAGQAPTIPTEHFSSSIRLTISLSLGLMGFASIPSMALILVLSGLPCTP